MKKPLITYFQAEDGSLYAGVQEYNGKISQLSQVVVKTSLLENVLDATLLVPERSKMVSILVGEIFLLDSFAWLMGFIVAFIGLVPGPPPLLPPGLSVAISGTGAGLLVVTQVWNAVAPRLYYPDPDADNGGGGGFWVSTTTTRNTVNGPGARNTRVFTVFLCSLHVLGLWYTLQTGSTLFARACLVQWAMSLGTILAIFRHRSPITSEDLHGTRLLNQEPSKVPLEQTRLQKRVLIPGLLLGLWSSALLAWSVGVIAEPHIFSALITLIPIPFCVAYRYLWIVYMVIIPEGYRADETVLAWSDFYSDLLRRIIQLAPSSSTTTTIVQNANVDTNTNPDSEEILISPPSSL